MTVRVLWLIKGLGPGGAERLLVEQAAGGDRSSFRYDAAYVLDWKQHLVPELEALGVRTHCLGVGHELDPRWVTRLVRLLTRERYDVVHAHSPFVASLGRVVNRSLPRDRRAAFVYTEHNRWPSYRRETRVANQVTFGLNDAVFAVSDDVKESIAARKRVRPDPVPEWRPVRALPARASPLEVLLLR